MCVCSQCYSDDVGLMGSMKEVRAVHASVGATSGFLTNVECFKCHEKGHMAKHCANVVTFLVGVLMTQEWSLKTESLMG